MKVMFDNGEIIDEAVGVEFAKKAFGRARTISIDRTEIIFFTAKGGLWNNYAKYLRDYILEDQAKIIGINEDK
jgi:hypothetical protein